MKVIAPSTFKLIEAKLHNYKQMETEIALWVQEIGMSSSNQKENIRGVGYVSDPTANEVLKSFKLDYPPKRIQDFMDWIEVIDKTIAYAKQHNSYKVYFMWYERGRQITVTSAYTRLGMPERTFKAKRWNIVNYAGVKALEKGLIKKLYENF